MELEGILPVSEQDLAFSEAFVRGQPLIDMYALASTDQIGIPIKFSSIAIHQLGNNLASALSLGNLEALNMELDWIKGFLHEQYQSPESLGDFLMAYANAIDSAMGKVGEPISSWLRKQV